MVRAGYKQTEVGESPEDWEVSDFGDAVEKIVGGGTPSRSNPLYWGEGIPWVTVKDFSTFNPFKTQESITQHGLKNSSSNLIPCGTLITSTRMAVGKVVIYDVDTAINQDLKAIFPKNNLSTKFLYYWFEYNGVLLEDLSSGSTVMGLSLNDLRGCTFVRPRENFEQQAIAKALSDVDGLIAGLTKLIAKKQDIKIGTMQQLLTGKTRLPGFGEGKGYKQTELGVIPEDWELIALGDLKDLKDNWAITGGPFGSNLKSSDYTEKGVRIIQLQNIGDGKFLDDYSIYTSYSKANELRSCNIYPGDIILSKMGDPVARACLIPPVEERYLMCSDGIRLKVNQKKFDTYFIFEYLNYSTFRKQAFEASTGSTRQRIGLTELRELLVISPPQKEQEKIGDVLSDMASEIDYLQTRLDKTKSIKQGMMQELLTGKTRLI
jgi:type I restriction enzyme S subunit